MKTNKIKKMICFFLLLTAPVAFSQKKELQVLHEEKVLGKNFITGTDIKGIEFTFYDRIHADFLDMSTNLLTVQLRGLNKNNLLNNTGYLLQYDIKNKKLLWNKKIKYQTSKIQQISETMIYTVDNISYCLDVHTGDNLWEAKNNIYFIDSENYIGVGYRYKSMQGLTEELEGIDLTTGRLIWRRVLSREYGWNNVFHINDSTLMLVADGLHAININTGQGWDYKMVTGAKDYTEAAIVSGVGIVLGLLTGTFTIATGPKLVTDVVSNTLVDSAYIYFAAKEQLVKVDKQSGNTGWKYPFPKGMASKSSLFMNDSVVYMINEGLAFAGYGQINFGKPFIAAFDRQTGKQKYFVLIDVKKNPILGIQLLDKEIYLAHKNKITKYDKETGFQITEKIFPKDNYGELKYFTGEQVFITNQDGKTLSLIENDSTKIYVYTNRNKILSVDNELNVTDIIDDKDVKVGYLHTDAYRFIAKGEKTSIINQTGEKIAEVDMGSNAFMIDDVLYGKQNKRFVAIDLKEIFGYE